MSPLRDAIQKAIQRFAGQSIVVYGSSIATTENEALRKLALGFGLRIDKCPTCNGRGRRAYGRETEDGCDECGCEGVVVIDPAEEAAAATALLAEIWRAVSAGNPPPMSDRAAWLAPVNDRVESASSAARYGAELLTAARTHLAATAESSEAEAVVAMTSLNSPDREAVWQRYLAAFDRTKAAEASLRSITDRIELETLRERMKEQDEQQAGVDKMFEETKQFIRQHEGGR